MLSIKSYLQATCVVIFIVGLVHLIRLVLGWVVVINDWVVPPWLSLVGVCGAWYLAYNAYILSQKGSQKSR